MLRLLLLLSVLASSLGMGIASGLAQTPRPKPQPNPAPLPLPENPPEPGGPKPGGPKGQPKAAPPEPEPEYIAGSGFVVGSRWVMTSSIFVRGKTCPVATQDLTIPGRRAAAGKLSLPALNRRVQPSVIQVFSRVGDCEITLKLPNGQLRPARVLRVDVRTGVALLASQAPLNLPALPIACHAKINQLTQPGEEIAVFGSSYGLPTSMSNGVVNAVRSMGGYSIVQVDAPTNRGTVGGPILDRQGNVVAVFTGDYRGAQLQNQGLVFGTTVPQVFQSLNLNCGG